MNIDGQCHCGSVTYQADIDPERCIDLPLHGLPDADRIALQGHGDLLGRTNPDDREGAQGLRQDRR
jgi:hypothetical protein